MTDICRSIVLEGGEIISFEINARGQGWEATIPELPNLVPIFDITPERAYRRAKAMALFVTDNWRSPYSEWDGTKVWPK
jgi:hypothetical protein